MKKLITRATPGSYLVFKISVKFDAEALKSNYNFFPLLPSEMLAKLCFTVLEDYKRGTQYLQQSLLSTCTQDVGMPKSDNTQ